MKSITIHKLEDSLARAIEERARRDGTSINQAVKKLLKGALGLEKLPPKDNHDQFLDQFGTWTEDEAKAFAARVADLEVVEAAEWREEG